MAEKKFDYLMESNDEITRLDLKTDTMVVKQQARWAGIKQGMRVLDLGCGTGKTSAALSELVRMGGSVTGVDFSKERIDYATRHRESAVTTFVTKDFTQPLYDLGTFDFIWIRFVLEYFRKSAFTIVENVVQTLSDNGILCLIDLDHNSMNHHPMPERLQKSLQEVIAELEAKADFDPYMGRRLYSFLYDLGFSNIRAMVTSHHLIYGDIGDAEIYNWMKKIEVGSKKIGYPFPRYRNGFTGFAADFEAFLRDPARFSYTPLIAACGTKNGGYHL